MTLLIGFSRKRLLLSSHGDKKMELCVLCDLHTLPIIGRPPISYSGPYRGDKPALSQGYMGLLPTPISREKSRMPCQFNAFF